MTDTRVQESNRGTSPNVLESASRGAGVIQAIQGIHWDVFNPFRPLPPAPNARRARAGTYAVMALVLAYIVYFTAYLWLRQDAFLTHAEDMGIMDQALWNTVHGSPLHQTVCNIVSDQNCLGNISRLAIHFEPLMFVISLLYLIAPSPKTIQLLQVGVVALGAFPAYWIAMRRLQSVWAGIAFAAVYLLYPALQAAVAYDFHAVTLSAAFLLFAIYFILARNNAWTFVAVVLALSTKEEIVLDVAMLGLGVLLLQRRWRVGGALLGLSLVWLAVELVIMHAVSPFGHSPTASRYAYLGSGAASAGIYVLTHPVQILKEHVFDQAGITYLRALLSPAGYVAILSPLTLVLSVPALGINLLSSDPSMHSGYYQYNAEIVPVLVFAAIEGVAVLLVVATWAYRQAQPAVAGAFAQVRASQQWQKLRQRALVVPFARIALIVLTLFVLAFSLYEQHQRGFTPLTVGFEWPQVTAHDRIGEQIAAMIPQNASVSAQSDLVPHVSHRHFIYMFPYMATQSDYVFLDVTGNMYPYFTQPDLYLQQITKVLSSGDYHVAAARDGYLLLKRGAPASPADTRPPYGLPASFYSFASQPSASPVPHPVNVQFGSGLHMVGYSVEAHTALTFFRSFTITTYWQVDGPVQAGEAPRVLLGRLGETVLPSDSFATTAWLPMNEWKPGRTYVLQSFALPTTPDRYGYLAAAVQVTDAHGSVLPVHATGAGASRISGDSFKLDTYFGG